MNATPGQFNEGFGCDRMLTWTCFRIFEKVFPEVVIALLFSELYSLYVVHVTRCLRSSAQTHTICTSPSRSMMSVNAFLLLPMRPSKNTISVTRSLSLHTLYA
jgi:hypothetical protein